MAPHLWQTCHKVFGNLLEAEGKGAQGEKWVGHLCSSVRWDVADGFWGKISGLLSSHKYEGGGEDLKYYCF